MGQITVFSGPERRRRWNDEQRLQILTEAFAPGACPTDVARRSRDYPMFSVPLLLKPHVR